MTAKLPLQLSEDTELVDHLSAEIDRAASEQEAYTIVVCVSQRLPGEEVSEVIQAGARCALNLVRDDDVVGLLDGDRIVVGLVNTTPNLARVFTYRLQGDLRIATSHLRNTVWETGYACLPEDGTRIDELLHAAVEGALERRRRLA